MMQRFGEKLRTLRERERMSQEALGTRLGFTREHVSNLERGKKRPSAEVVLRIANLFGVLADVLMRDELDI
jgi:transcriptional regulator with XRE-family HTH domain